MPFRQRPGGVCWRLVSLLNMSAETLVALLHGPDQPGLVAKTAGWIFARGGNILHADQHRDLEEGVFFQRIEWEPSASSSAHAEVDAFQEFAGILGMQSSVAATTKRTRVALFISKADHCFHDLVLRWRANEFPCDILAVVSNHETLEPVARGYGLPFYHIPVVAAAKAEAEARQVAPVAGVGVVLGGVAR